MGKMGHSGASQVDEHCVKPVVGPRSLADLRKGVHIDGDNGSDPKIMPPWVDLERPDWMKHLSLTRGHSGMIVCTNSSDGTPSP